MKNSFLVIVFFLLPILSITSCSAFYDKDYGEINYTGEGKFSDKGSDASYDRFLLDLGQVEFDQKSTKSYTIKGLPEAPFTIVLQIDTPVSNNFPLESLSNYPQLESINEIVLSLELEDMNGNKIFTYNGPFSKLNRNVRQTEKGYRPIYYLEPQANTPGTHFTPNKKMTYRLNLSVINTNRPMPKINIIAVGHSGWK